MVGPLENFELGVSWLTGVTNLKMTMFYVFESFMPLAPTVGLKQRRLHLLSNMKRSFNHHHPSSASWGQRHPDRKVGIKMNYLS